MHLTFLQGLDLQPVFLELDLNLAGGPCSH